MNVKESHFIINGLEIKLKLFFLCRSQKFSLLLRLALFPSFSRFLNLTSSSLSLVTKLKKSLKSLVPKVIKVAFKIYNIKINRNILQQFRPGIFSLLLMNELHQDPLVLENVTLNLQVKVLIKMAIDLFGFSKNLQKIRLENLKLTRGNENLLHFH